MEIVKKRQKVHVDILVEDLVVLDKIAEELDLKRTDLIRVAIREYIRKPSHP